MSNENKSKESGSLKASPMGVPNKGNERSSGGIAFTSNYHTPSAIPL